MALRTPLAPQHEKRGAKFTEFGGWEMPVSFDSITAEHRAVRERAGKFDVSHMGRIAVRGPDAEALMQRLTTNDVGALEPGDAQYAMIVNDEGIILDDTVVYRLPAAPDDGAPGAGAAYLFIPNAGHDAEMHERWSAFREQWGLDADVENRTDDYGMVAVQGPDAEDLVAEAVGEPSGDPSDESIRDRSRFSAGYETVEGVPCWVARTGYTGEDGFELVFPAGDAETVWGAFDCQACGLGARDTLRIEMGFLLSGQDFHPEENPRTPYEAGVGFTVDLDTEFVGRDALAAAAEEGPDETFVGVLLEERGVPRSGYPITDGSGTEVGTITSGTMSPTLDEPIGLGYVETSVADDGTEVAVVIRDEPKRATITTPPFLERDT